MKKITKFNLNTGNIPQGGEVRKFSVIGDEYAVFSLEILNEDGDYYNFTSQVFGPTVSKIENEVIAKGEFNGVIVFPAVSDEDHYDIRLWASDAYDTKHSKYNEVRLEDNSVDINASFGSDSNLIKKIIYQYLDVTVSLKNVATNASSFGTIATSTQEITGNLLGVNNKKYSFSITATVGGDKGVTILRQPKATDAYIATTRQYGAAEVIPGEDLYQHARPITTTVNGATSSSNRLVLDATCTALGLVVGDALVVGAYTDKLLLITHVDPDDDNDNEIQLSAAVSIADAAVVTFYYKGYYRWNIHANSSLHGIKEGMVVDGDSGVQPHINISNYERKSTLTYVAEQVEQPPLAAKGPTSSTPLTPVASRPGVTTEIYIDKVSYPAIEFSTIAPTYTNGVISKKLGIITHNVQQYAASANANFKVYAFGAKNMRSLTYCDPVFSNLKAELTEVTTNTSSAISNANLAVDDMSGAMNNITRVKAIGMDASVSYPLITSGAGSDGAGTLTMDSSQVIEDNQVVTFLGTGNVVTITGQVEFKQFPNEDIDLAFDVSRFLLMN
tara:strand:- start:61 stop:1734 length:1674 start_codon:yes stop_codon:yes gene_type:complete